MHGETPLSQLGFVFEGTSTGRPFRFAAQAAGLENSASAKVSAAMGGNSRSGGSDNLRVPLTSGAPDQSEAYIAGFLHNSLFQFTSSL